jgi:hypothetical protein
VIVKIRKHLKSALVKEIDAYSPGMVVESKTECEMDAAVKIYIRESKCQSSSSKTNEQENLPEESSRIF